MERAAKKTALVLGGGGSRGAYQLGVWQVLRDMDIRIDIITGASIGALNGCMAALGKYDEAEKLWDTITTTKIYALDGVDESDTSDMKALTRNITFGFLKNLALKGGTDSEKLRALLAPYIDENALRSSDIEYGVTVFDLKSGSSCEIYVDEMEEGFAADYILGSAAVYPAIKPIEINGGRYIDGGFCDNLPYKLAMRRNAERFIVVDLDAVGKCDREGLKDLPDLTYIKPRWDLGPTMVFEHTNMHRSISLGRLDAMKAFGILYGIKYAFTPDTKGEFIKLTLHSANLAGFSEMIGKNRGGIWETLTGAKFSHFFEGRLDGKITADRVALACAELAGEIFGADPTKIYTLERFNERIAQRYDAAPEMTLQTPLSGTDGLIETLLMKIAPGDRAQKTKRAAEMIAQAAASGNVQALPDAAVMTEEFLAGLYLFACGIV